jgi:tripartite-type tricarboxylate transporter receptor subunit TctC
MRTPERVIWDPRTPEEQTAGVQAALKKLDAQRAVQRMTEPGATDLQAKTREAAQQHASSRGRRFIPHITDK